MSPALPIISGKDAIKAFLKVGWTEKSRKGSHVKLVNPNHPNPIVIPLHGNKPLDRGTLASIIKHSGLSVSEFIDLL
ncbi:MAG TPA: type II toxin-antitoxin system HicA family toxin [bacterium]|nr:type II toxin-antitoxin system HicA family toxin [bacterium]